MAVNKLDVTMMEDVGTSASQLLQRDGSGNIPAVDGSQITGVTEFTTSTSDPAIDTNPAGGVGSLWYNKTGGEMYCCTDATAGANIWTNVGAGSGDVKTWQYGGTQYGYTSAGGYPVTNIIEKFSFTSDGNSTDIGDMTQGRNLAAGNSGPAFGYMSGGGNPNSNVIDKFSFTSDGNATDVGNLTATRMYCTG